MMFTCQLDPASRTTLCDQLCEAVRKAISCGELPAGSRLPSKRQLSDHLQVSISTVESAIGSLISEGWCESRPRSGVFVCEQLPDDDPMPETKTPILYDFSVGAADAGLFPYAAWARLMREVLSEQDHALLQSGHPQGLYSLRKAISELLLRMRGIDASPEQIVVGAGMNTLVSSIIRLIGRDKLYAVEDPGYPHIRRNLVYDGCRILPLPLTAGAVDVRQLYSSGAGAVYLTPSRQFPTGIQMDPRQKQSLLTWSRETGGILLEDDYDNEFRYSGKPGVPLCSMDPEANAIYLNTFSRTLAPGLRLSYMVLPKLLVRQYAAVTASCTVSGFEQETLRKFIESGQLERHIARVRRLYKERLQTMSDSIEQLGLGSVLPCRSGLYLLLNASGRCPAHELVSAAAKAGVRLTRMVDYSILETQENSETSRIVLLSFSGMDPDKIRLGLKALSECWL